MNRSYLTLFLLLSFVFAADLRADDAPKDDGFVALFNGVDYADLKNQAEFQNDDGSINLHLNNDTINLHTLCYAFEGLLYGYYITKFN